MWKPLVQGPSSPLSSLCPPTHQRGHASFCCLRVSASNWSRIDSTSSFPSADVIVTTNGDPVSSKEIKSCIHQIQDLIVVRLNKAVANKLISSVDYLRESFVGTLERCLSSLEKSHLESSVHNITSDHLKQVSGGEDPLGSRPIGDLRGVFNPPLLWSGAVTERRLSRGGHLPLRVLRHEALLGADQAGQSPGGGSRASLSPRAG